MQQKICPHCKKPNDSDMNFCVFCGNVLIDEPEPSVDGFCTACGAKIDADDLFCTACGAKRDDAPVIHKEHDKKPETPSPAVESPVKIAEPEEGKMKSTMKPPAKPNPDNSVKSSKYFTDASEL